MAKAKRNGHREYGTGTLEWRSDHWWVRVSLPDGTRPRYRLCEGRTCACATMSEERRREAAAAVAERERESVRREVAEQQQADAEARLTVRQFGERWTSGKLYETHGEVRGLRVKASASDDESRLEAHVYPLIGPRPIADITEAEIERTLAEAARRAATKRGKPWRQATKFQVYQAMRRLFDLAVKPGRLRTDNPVSRDLRPRKDKPKLFGFLYPAELLALLGCREVLLVRRVLYAVAVYTGLRKGSLRALRWGDVDFVNRTLTVLTTKTDVPLMFEISADLAAVLQAYRERLGNPSDKTPIIGDLGCKPDREAETLRADLKAAGVTREILFSDSANVEPLRFHDMRGTFVTWARRQGRGQGWITDRSGHLTTEMVERYNRAARTLADLKYEPFPDITTAIPELAEDRDNLLPFRRPARGG